MIRRTHRRLFGSTLTAFGCALLVQSAAAQTGPVAQPKIFVETALLPVARAMALPADAPSWQEVPTAGLGFAAACAAGAETAPRLLLTAEAPGRLALEGCRNGPDGRRRIETLPIGRMAVALVVPARGAAVAADSAATFRAIAEAAPQPGAASTQPLRTVSTIGAQPQLPGIPAPLLAPAAGSLAWKVFAATALDAGCSATLGMHVPFTVAERAEVCSALRGGASAHRAPGDLAALSAWAREAPRGAAAVVTLAELRALGSEVLPVPFEGVLPTIGNVASGTYPLSVGLHLLVVRPAGAGGPALDAARDFAFEILSERSLGPSGPVAALGVAPMPPTERVSARAAAFTLLRGRP